MIGTDHERFISAINICAAVFQKHGYMQLGSTTLTGKGMRNNTRHRLEVDAGRKSSTYKSIVERLWRGYMDRRVKERQKSESVAPPQKKVLTGTQQKPPIAPPSTNTAQTKVIGATNNTAKVIGPNSNIGRKPPFGTEE